MFEKLDMKTINFTDENIKKLAEIFPNVVSEDENGKVIDFEALKQELSGNIVEGYKERYSLNWPGKRKSQLKANTPTTKTLRPCIEDSVNFDTTENLYIEGDNLEVLKILQEGYLNKIKMIYIDPPYNTGKDFVYKDNFTRDSEEELLESGQIDEEGGKLVANPETNGRYHSDWLSMMYPRLKLARNLLKDDGVIFISIDDNEVHNLRKICDEIYGEENFIVDFVWKTRQASGKQVAENNTSSEHEYILCYQKSKVVKFLGVDRDSSSYNNPDNDPRGDWAKHPLDVGSTKDERPNCFYDLVDPETGNVYSANPNRVWAYAPDSMRKLLDEGKILFDPNGKTRPYLKKFWTELKSEFKPISTWLDRNTFDIGYNTEGTKLLNKIFDGKKIFDYPKPLSILKLLIKQTTMNDDVVLDFFSGSASTAQAIFEQNVEDSYNRKFIMTQLPEEMDEKSEAYKVGYKTISEIGKERIRRAGKKIVEESGKTDLDIGFRVLKLDDSNMKDIYFTPQELGQSQIDYSVDNIKEDRSDLDLLFGVLIDWGVDLTLPIKKEVIQGKDCYFVDRDSLCAYFGNDIDEEFIKELAKKEALRFVFKDSSFGNNDDLKDNVSQVFKQLNPSAEIKVI